EDDHEICLRESVHLAENLIERLFVLVVTAAEPRAALAADGVDLVDEDDRRRTLLRGIEQIANAASADADEHLNELGAGDGIEGDARFAGDAAGQERLARPGGTIEEHALGHPAAELLELFGILQELDDFHQIGFDAFDARDVLERDG